MWVADLSWHFKVTVTNACLCLALLGSPDCEWLGLLCFQAYWNWLFLALQGVSNWACFVCKPAENECLWCYSWWVTGLALFSSLLKMVNLGSSVGKWLGLLCYEASWKWWSLALQDVSDWACFCFQCLKWLSLALQDVSGWVCFVFKPAENGCLWLFSMWVTKLALFSSLLKMVVLGSSVCEWLGLLCSKAYWKWLFLAV